MMSDPDKANDAGSRVLLVDDDEVFCQVLQNALSRRGCEVSVAHNIDDAIELAQQLDPDRAVIDLRIGEESGLVLVERLRRAVPGIRMLMLTGYASIATAVEAIKLGAVQYLTKPADAQQILDAFTRIEGHPGIELSSSPPSVRRLEWEHLQKVLLEHDGNVSATARALGMHRRTLQRKLAKRPVRS